jgi:diguanylate cyclase (GGDEF)-like protein
MDPLTAILIATFMMLLNGGVLGLIHHDLPPSLQPSAVSWRIGTLLMAGGGILLALQRHYPIAFILPVANGLLATGLTCYWHSMRQFYNRPARWWIWLAPVMAALSVWWYAWVTPSLAGRIIVSSSAWAAILYACAWTMRSFKDDLLATSRRVMMGIFMLIGSFSLCRGIYAALVPLSFGDTVSQSTINVLSPFLLATLPIIGTTAFLLMCSERIRRQWERAASTDDLTGLANRRTLANIGSQRLRSTPLQDELCAIAIIDIDHFKSINDRFGHDVGDRALQYVAHTLLNHCTASDLVGRQGGEEFVAVLCVTDAAQAREKCEAFRLAVSGKPFNAENSALTITVSIGVTLQKPNEHSLDALLHRADVAMYRAKADGRDRVILA